MLRQPASRIPRPGAIESPTGDRVDRSMDILQYATALLAIIVAVLLAAIH